MAPRKPRRQLRAKRSLTLDQDVALALAAWARAEDRGLSNLMRRILSEAVTQRQAASDTRHATA